MNKSEILEAIRRIAAANNGKPPGSQRFATETGLRKSDWYPALWVRWGDAVREAGLQPNSLSAAPPDDALIAKHIDLIRELGRFPIESDLRLRPHARGLGSLGNKRQRAGKVLAYCREHAGFEDVIPFCEMIATAEQSSRERLAAPSGGGAGYVYLIQHGSRAEYKIGRTSNLLRREGEIRVELPEKIRPVHSIKTDDPAGVEAYWHRRFAERRKEGEWFALSSEDLRAFRRWRRIF